MKLKYSAKKIAKQQFTGVEKGYEPLEVDEFLDGIIEDYLKIDGLVKELDTALQENKEQLSTIESLNKQIQSFQERIKELDDLRIQAQTELAFQKSRIEKALGNFRGFDSSIDELNYIKALETELVQLGGDPDKCRKHLYKKSIDLSRIKK